MSSVCPEALTEAFVHVEMALTTESSSKAGVAHILLRTLLLSAPRFPSECR